MGLASYSLLYIILYEMNLMLYHCGKILVSGSSIRKIAQIFCVYIVFIQMWSPLYPVDGTEVATVPSLCYYECFGRHLDVLVLVAGFLGFG